MSATPRRIAWAVFAGLAAAVAGAALAWACTPSAQLTIDPESGPPGSNVTVSGASFISENVEIRWDSEGGRLLATVKGPEFSERVTVPQAAEGRHEVVVVAHGIEKGPWQGQKFVREAPFTVTSPGSSSAGGGGGGSGGEAVPGSGPTGGGRPPRPDVGTGGRGAGGRAPGGARAGAGAPSGAGAITAGRGRVFADSLAPLDRRRGAAAQAPGPGAGPAESSAVGDLWSGFGAGRKGALGRDGPVVEAPATSSAMKVGMALLGLGLAVLLAGFCVAAARRRPLRSGRGGLR